MYYIHVCVPIRVTSVWTVPVPFSPTTVWDTCTDLKPFPFICSHNHHTSLLCVVYVARDFTVDIHVQCTFSSNSCLWLWAQNSSMSTVHASREELMNWVREEDNCSLIGRHPDPNRSPLVTSSGMAGGWTDRRVVGVREGSGVQVKE